MDSQIERFPNIYRKAIATAALVASSLGIAACACSPDQVEVIAPSTSTGEMTTGDSGTTIDREFTGTTELPTSTTSTTEAPTTTVDTTPITTTPEEENTREADRIDMYGFGAITMGMSREEILDKGFHLLQGCGDAMSINTGEPGGVTIDLDDNEQVEQISIWKDESIPYETYTYETISHAKLGSYPDALTQYYYKKAYDAGQLVFHNFPNGGMGFELTAYPETGNSLWFILDTEDVYTAVKAFVLTPFGEMPKDC